LTGSGEAELRLITDDAGAARVLTIIVRGYDVLYYKYAAATSTTRRPLWSARWPQLGGQGEL
jgi:hypothetical protein